MNDKYIQKYDIINELCVSSYTITPDTHEQLFFIKICLALTQCIIQFNAEKFILVKEALLWDDARAICKERGAELASIANTKEKEILRKVLSEDGLQIGWYTWTGLTDKASNGTYSWSDGTEGGLIEWADGEPNDPNGGQTCAAIQFDSMELFDVPCNWDKFFFACKYF